MASLDLGIGGFSIPALLLCVLRELCYKSRKHNLIVAGLYILTGILIPYIFAHVLFYIPNNKIYTFPVLLELRFNSVLSFLALILLQGWNLFIILFSQTLKKISIVKGWVFESKVYYTLVTMSIILIIGFLVFKYAYNNRAEIMLGIDHHVQQAEWGEALKLSDRYPDLNSLVIYYTNLALYKNGLLSDKMFSYPQIGAKGLRLSWERSYKYLLWR